VWCLRSLVYLRIGFWSVRVRAHDGRHSDRRYLPNTAFALLACVPAAALATEPAYYHDVTVPVTYASFVFKCRADADYYFALAVDHCLCFCPEEMT